MWRSIFLHGFIDHRINNFQALPGTSTPPSLALRATTDALPGVNAVRISPGVGFEYALREPLQQVIGVSCRVRLMYPTNPQTGMFSVVRLGSGAELLMWPVSHPTADRRMTRSLARVWVGSGFKNLGNVMLPARHFMEFRFDWHTSGQARILADGRLVAYHNAVSPGAMFAVDRVAFGMPNMQSPPGSQPLYHVARVFVRVLQRPDALAGLSRLLPKVKVPPDQARCHARVVANALSMVDRLRQFMAQIHQSLSQPWSAQVGPADGPFRPEAVMAHDLATVAVSELVRMLRTSDYTAPDRFLDAFTEFLRILYAAQPQQFAALASELGGIKVVPDACRDVFERVPDEEKQAFEPIIKLLTEASERVRQIAGGN